MTANIMKLLGIDYGDSKVGLAIADTESGVALPYIILKNNGWNNLIEELKKIFITERIEKIIIGLPVDKNGNESEQALRVREFSKKLNENTSIPIDYLDERFSTRQAQDLSPGRQEDDVAAMLVLQNYLDKIA